jgi:hypothetical protein
MLAAIGKTPDASASHSVSAKKSAGEKTPEGPRKRQIAGEKGRSDLPQADLTAGNVGRISSPRYSEKSVYGWLAVEAVHSELFSAVKFRANREKYRENSPKRFYRTAFAARSTALPGILTPLPSFK